MQQKTPINFYLILNVSSKASHQEIKQAYLKLAQTYHPDKNRGNKLAEKKFQQINQAWQTLKDSKKRALFDKTLNIFKKNQELIKLSQIKAAQTSPTKKIMEKPIDLEIPLEVSLEDICQSSPKTVHYFRSINGKKVKSSLVVQVPTGVSQGARLRFKGKGGTEGQKKMGDLYIKILFRPHSLFQRMDASKDLLLTRPVSFIDAIKAEKLDIPSPYGLLTLELTPPLTDNQLLKIKEQGLPKNTNGDKADLFVKILIDYPTENRVKIQKQMETLSFDQQRIFIKKFEGASFVFPQVLSFQRKMQKLNKLK